MLFLQVVDSAYMMTPSPSLRARFDGTRRQGQRAKQALSGYVFDRHVTVEWDKRDRYGRTIGKILDGERDVNLALVREGMSWWYRKYADEQSPVDRGLYEAAEAKAKMARAGLWSDPDPVPPWDWRYR